MIGTTMALIGLAAASAGSKAVSSAIQSHAAKSAAKTQATSATQAQDFLAQIYGQQAALMKPYQDYGQGGLRTLSGVMGQGMGRPGAPPPMAINGRSVWGVQ